MKIRTAATFVPPIAFLSTRLIFALGSSLAVAFLILLVLLVAHYRLLRLFGEYLKFCEACRASPEAKTDEIEKKERHIGMPSKLQLL